MEVLKMPPSANHQHPAGDILCFNNDLKLARVEVSGINGQRLKVVKNSAVNEINVSQL
jgi:hypothetical protein